MVSSSSSSSRSSTSRRRRSSARRVGRSASEGGGGAGTAVKAPEQLDDALRVWNEQVRPGLASAWKAVSPVLASVWIYSALLWTFLLSWAGQRAIKAYDESQDEDKRLTKVESAVTHGRLFHEMISVLVMRMNPFWSRSVEWEMPLEEIPPRAIWMANHISFADPFVLCGVLPETKAVGQARLFDMPVVGEIFRNNGDMAVFFEKKPDGRWGTKPGSKEALMDQAREYLAHDVPVAVFPEGTITKSGALMDFKPGFFKLAVEQGVPIVPIAMWGNQEAWPMDLSNRDVSTPRGILQPAEICIRVGKPIDIEGLTVDEARDVVWERIDHMTRQLPNYSLRAYEQ